MPDFEIPPAIMDEVWESMHSHSPAIHGFYPSLKLLLQLLQLEGWRIEPPAQ